MGDLADAAIKGGNTAVLLSPVLEEINPLKNVMGTFGIRIQTKNAAVILQ
jgi:hypothetical protein